MSRWAPDARSRLTQAALELYRERGFDRTAVAEIAARAGLTERTFFRHFADKREVLFGNEDLLRELLMNAVTGAPAAAGAMDAMGAALDALATFFPEERREHARQRQLVIDANPSLQERELLKLASLAAATAEALRRRGVVDPDAGLAGEAGMAVFRIAFARWIGGGHTDDREARGNAHSDDGGGGDDQRDLPNLIRDTFTLLRTLACSPPPPPPGKA
ncbi:TetR family transcriptional regulator [Parafrankia elaeagni]|uniref:TetR family transcriptional regulator n=1 Tax=Parafrankia elaeagni TaxID=222534 RepID=UPI000367E29C|nr:TetR family transcriptional regulator [Parafrankia elaeagni]